MTQHNDERWSKHWNEVPAQFSDTDFLSQVGKTQNRIPVGANQIALIIGSIVEGLNLQPEDTVLDLCCGNGYLTAHVAEQCHSITGVDFSHPLIDVANRHHRGSNTSYLEKSVLALEPADFGEDAPFSKIYMYEALQHFADKDFPAILLCARRLIKAGGLVLIASIPDRTRLRNFYNTPDRWRDYERRLQDGNEAIGTWWEPEALRIAAEHQGFRCELRPQPSGLYTAHYRFNAVLSPA